MVEPIVKVRARQSAELAYLTARFVEELVKLILPHLIVLILLAYPRRFLWAANLWVGVESPRGLLDAANVSLREIST